MLNAPMNMCDCWVLTKNKKLENNLEKWLLFSNFLSFIVILNVQLLVLYLIKYIIRYMSLN